jgi:transcriptional regulator with XRE-family HTH domain
MRPVVNGTRPVVNGMRRAVSGTLKSRIDASLQARQEAGLTQVQAAERLGKPQSYVSKVERAERRIDPPELARFAEVYGKTIASFLTAGPFSPTES